LIAMGRIVKLPPFKPRLARHQGLRKVSPDLIGKARDETAAQVTRVGLTFLGTAAFCLLSLLSPDTSLLGGSEKISVPFAGPVSFLGFMLLGPAVLIVLRIYLQIYVEHSARLDRLARLVSAVRAPTLVPLENPLIGLFSGLIFYALLPVALMLFAWKAAVFPAWGLALFSVAAVVIASHVMLLTSRLSWRSKGLTSISVAIIAGGAIVAFGPLQRPFNLYRANLPGHWLGGEDLHKADLRLANLSGADLSGANLIGADLRGANLSGADLHANLSHADLRDANLRGANLDWANLSGATLAKINLNSAKLWGAKLDGVNLLLADLSDADLRSTDLSSTDLSKANLSGANLSSAWLSNADLSGANLSGADLSGANLSGADLSGAENLTQTQLDKACGNAKTKPPTLKACP
jgi:uncharacterized protein YjbI with pentapeptide repeats